ncbi:basic leucine zipper transcriptional factor ATF-like 3 isoform X1 [Ictidomys tridecemlineatus]
MSQGLLTDSSVLQRSVAAPGNQPQPQDSFSASDREDLRAPIPTWARQPALTRTWGIWRSPGPAWRSAPTPLFTCLALTGDSRNELERQSPEDDDRKVRRREKNRVAAQRSRKKQTQKADKLHEEYECLEQENTMLRKEIGKLTEELRHLSEALKEHEKMCPLLLCPMNFVQVPRPDPVASCLPR